MPIRGGQANGVLASISLLGGDRLRRGAAPSVPKACTDAINGAAIEPSAGSCRTAAYRGEPFIMEDIATDPSWAEHRDLALRYSLRAGWSVPVPSLDQEFVNHLMHLAGVAI
jgi:GAF domain-containing protein